MDGYNAFMLVATLLVLMMTTPALALFYGGMTRSKSVLNMMMMSFVSMGVVGIIWVLWGYSMVFGDDDGTFFANPFTNLGLKDIDYGSYTFMMFQLTFAVITAALISGAIADRVKFSSWLIFLPLWVTLSYFPLAHMVFGCTDAALICTKIGAQDYAGGTAVHINAGVAGLVLALVIGKRVGWPKDTMRPHNLTLTMMGAALLWVGWYGFNVGSIVFSGDNDVEALAALDKSSLTDLATSASVPVPAVTDIPGLQTLSDALNNAQFLNETGITFANTTLATMAAMLAWLLVERLLHGKATSLGAASGVVAGLVAITPACGAVDIVGAIAIGVISGALCAWAVSLKFKFGFDDSLDVVGVHLVGGIVGTVLIGLFSTTSTAGAIDGLFYGGGLDSLWNQSRGVAVAIAWSGVVTLVIALAIKYTIGWRVSEEAEVDGIDLAEHGESAYDLHTGVGGGVGSSTGFLATGRA